MLLMLRITDRLQQIVEAGYSATALGRSVSLTRQARRVSASWFKGQAFPDRDSMVPAATEVIGVHSLYPESACCCDKPVGAPGGIMYGTIKAGSGVDGKPPAPAACCPEGLTGRC